MAKKIKRILIVDGDPYAFKAAVTSEEPIHWDDGILSAHTNVKLAIAKATDEINALAKRLKAEVVFCWAGENRKYFRHDIGSYKAERKLNVRPLGLKEIKEGIAANFPDVWLPNIEADDVIGILATDPEYKPGYEKIIVSIDKDLKTIPGLFLNPDKMDEPILRTKEEADLFFHAQAIAGDKTDGFDGAPGFGMQTAEKLLDKEVQIESYLHTLTRGARKGEVEERKREIPAANPWETIVSCYEFTGLDESDALLNARMARILTAELWDKENQKPILWSPENGAL